eukprot:snap_masked-scaffold_3-processed-gene-20.16-mRNA-1 protein AED:1.00 eAED:1.00 QI:0/-1/0/0/-1/1/1/0/145
MIQAKKSNFFPVKLNIKIVCSRCSFFFLPSTTIMRAEGMFEVEIIQTRDSFLDPEYLTSQEDLLKELRSGCDREKYLIHDIRSNYICLRSYVPVKLRLGKDWTGSDSYYGAEEDLDEESKFAMSYLRIIDKAFNSLIRSLENSIS